MRTVACLVVCSLFAACAIAEEEHVKSVESFVLDPNSPNLLSPTDQSRLTAAFDEVLARGETTIAQLETEIANLEARNQQKQLEANALVSRIAAREQELRNQYNVNLVICLFFPNPAVCVLANYLANDSLLQSYKQQLAAARAVQQQIAIDMQSYRTKRDTLRAKINVLRTGKQQLLALLASNTTPTYPPSLASSPETGVAYWRQGLYVQIGNSLAQEIALLVELRNAAVELSNVLDQSLLTLRGLEQSVDELVEESRETFMDLVTELLTGDPAAHAEEWLDDVLAAQTRNLLKPLGWPMSELARYLIERDGSPEELLEQLLQELDGTGLPPTIYTVDTPVNIYDLQTASSPLTVTVDRAFTTVEVYVDITHPYIGDVEAWIEHGGYWWMLSSRVGGSNDDLRKTWTLLGADMTSVLGAWTLKVADREAADEGRLNYWQLIVR